MNNDLRTILSEAYGARGPWSHKGDFGYVLVISGSHLFTGSPVFSGLAALRAGADLVTVVGHPRAMDVVAAYSPDLITSPLRGELSINDVPRIKEMSSRFHAVVLGGGLDFGDMTHEAILSLASDITLPMVLDAEAIRALIGHTEILRGKKILLTPNSIEWEALTGEAVGEDVEHRAFLVEKYASLYGVTILLKGNIDIISDGKNTIKNSTGNPFMTKGGTGDTLAGIAGALMARKLNPLDVGVLASYINGKAGELASEGRGEGMLASDLLAKIPDAIYAS